MSLYEVKAWNDRVAAGTDAGLTVTDVATMAQEAMQASVDALSALPPAGDASPGRKGR